MALSIYVNFILKKYWKHLLLHKYKFSLCLTIRRLSDRLHSHSNIKLYYLIYTVLEAILQMMMTPRTLLKRKK